MLKMPKNGILAKGKKELEAYHSREKLTPLKAVLAKCYECMGRYIDGRRDCQVTDCPLYEFMPYKGKK
jgi:hypothetical protein